MSFKDTLNQKLIIISYHLTTEQLFKARENRNWEEYDKMTEVEKLQTRLEEFSIYEDLLEDLSEENYYEIIKEINGKRFD